MTIEFSRDYNCIDGELLDKLHTRVAESILESAVLLGESTRMLEERDIEEKFMFAVRNAKRLS